MDQGPLVTEQIEAGERLAKRYASSYRSLRAAFWLKESDAGYWYLHLVSDEIDDSNFDDAYGEIIELLRDKPEASLDLFQIKVSGVDEPVAKGVLELQSRYPARLPTRIRNTLVGKTYVEEAYVYPIPMNVVR